MTKRIWLCLVAAALVAVSGCSAPDVPKGPAPPVALVAVDDKSPAGPASEEPNLSVASDGSAYMSWLEPAKAGGYALLFSARSSGGMWSEPKTIVSGTDWFVNAADFPSITAMPDGTLAAHWLGNNEPGSEAYNINIVFSHDKGATWSKPVVPHRDRKKQQHGFLSLLPSTDGKLGAVWLDGRQYKDGDDEGDMALIYTTIAPDGTLGQETILDPRACECCHTSAAATPDGIAVVYRDRSDKEIRDISIVRYANGSWSPAEPLSQDGWEINGCPVNGPAISSNGQNVAAAWFTAPEDKARVSVVMSADGGKTFGKPIQIDEGKPTGHVDILSLPSGAAVVSWLERKDQGQQIRIRQVNVDGSLGSPITVSGDTGVRSAGFPRMGSVGNQVLVAWTDGGKVPQVRTALLK